ncbi:MAG: CsgG/HfaB family protein [Stenotrophomonas sp.]
MASYGLPAPTRMLRVMVNDSRCFTVLDRGVGFAAAQAERDLALDGHLQAGQNLGGGQMRGADYVLIPDIVSQNANAGGMNIGGGASTPQKRGLMAGVLNVATLGVSGKLSTQKQTAEVVLTLVDVRTSEQLISVSGEAKITDKAWAAAVAASNVQGSARVNAGSWENTEIGQVIKEAYEEAFSRMVSQINRKRGEIQTQPAPQAVFAGAAPVPMAAPQPVVPAAVPAVAPLAVAAPVVTEADASAYEPAPMPAVAAPQAPAAAGAAQLARAGTLVLRRMARLLTGASNQSEAIAELKTGMLLFPTGTIEGSMLEVEDEMGNKGWVPAAAVESA